MSREIRRVPLNFAQPLNQTWEGYLLPEKLRLAKCAACDGRGLTPARQWVEAITSDLLMLDDDLRAQAQGRSLHPFLANMGRGIKSRPSVDIAQFGEGLAGRKPGFMGHDSSDGWKAAGKIIQAAGLDPKTWGMCTACHDGEVEKYEGQRDEAEAWEPTDPPTGPAWQLWETVSEGSPISPAFPEREGLVHWLTTPAYTWGSSQPLTREQAEAFVTNGYAFTMIYTPKTGLIPGDQFAGEQSND